MTKLERVTKERDVLAEIASGVNYEESEWDYRCPETLGGTCPYDSPECKDKKACFIDWARQVVREKKKK